MHILYVTPYFLPYRGGVEEAIYQTAVNILAKDTTIKISILTTFSSYPTGSYGNLPAEEIINGITVYRRNFIPRNLPGLYHSNNAGLFSFQVGQVLAMVRPDIIHLFKTEWYVPNTIIYLLNKNKSKYVFSSSFHRKPMKLRHTPMVWFNRYLLNNMNAITVASNETAKALSEVFFVSNDIKIVHWGSKAIFPEAKKTTSKRVNILCVGRLSNSKGQYRFLQEYIKLAVEIRKRTRLFFVGLDGGDLKKINQLLHQHHLDNVYVLTNISDKQLNAIMTNSDILISPSAYEAFGLTIVDALMRGLPVVAFNQGAIPEIAAKGATLINYPEWENFIHAVIELVLDPGLRINLGKEGRGFATTTYSWEKTASKFIEIYNKIC